MQRPLGLIAGLGEFPLEVARAARRRGDVVFAAGIRGLTRPDLEAEVDELQWFHLGELSSFLEAFVEAGVRDAVMAGKVPKSALFESEGELRLDALAQRLLARLADRRDDSLLGAFADVLEEGGVKLHGQAALTPELVVEEGVLGACPPDESFLADVAFGWPVATALAGLDVGQSVVVKDRAVLALEAIEGTDAALERGALLGGPGTLLVKVAKPAQDPRFDVPVIGLDTIEALVRGGARGVVVEAGQTVFLQREEAMARADAEGLVVLGMLCPAAGGGDPDTASSLRQRA
jgi:DUF1009 family protein